jgi:hypothetical protein
MSGSLPSGLTLAGNGELYGTPGADGTFNFTVQVTDNNSLTTNQALSLIIYPYTWITNNGTITIKGGYSGSGSAVTIPSTINGLPVTSIGDNAFWSSSLTSVTIPNSVTSIGDLAFDYCTNLASVMIGTNVTSIGYEAFADCCSLTSVTIPNSVTSIGDYAFVGCTSLTNVTIPNSVTSIGDSAFDDCSSLSSVTIGNSVTSIGDGAFEDCASLTNVYFQGNAPTPTNDLSVFSNDNNATVYYLPGTTGWGTTFDGRPTALWLLPNPVILNNNPAFGVQTNRFGFVISWATNLSVVVEACTNLASHTWSPVATNPLAGGTNYFSDAKWTNYPSRFYRVRSQ